MKGWHEDGHSMTVLLGVDEVKFNIVCPNQTFSKPEDRSSERGFPMFGTAEHVDPKAPCAFGDGGCMLQEEVANYSGHQLELLDNDEEYEVTGTIPLVWFYEGGLDHNGEYDYEFMLRPTDYHNWLKEKGNASTISTSN